MVYERLVTTMPQLLREVEGLEYDSGIRMTAKIDGEKKLVFVTKHSGEYSLWVRKNEETKGGSFRRFSDFPAVKKFLSGIVDKPLKAYVY